MKNQASRWQSNYAPITAEYLDYDEVMAKYDKMMDWLVDIYVNTLNLIQYMHDKYYYEAAELSLMDTDLKRTFATGIAGFSHVIDSLSAIKYAKVKVVRDENGLAKKTSKSKETSRSTEMMMTVQMKSEYGCLRLSWIN